MEQSKSAQAPTRVIAERVKELRKQHGWSAERLAEAMTAVGIPWTRMVVTKLETGRRAEVSVEEFLALAYVLDVAPVHLLVPIDNEPDDRYRPVPSVVTTPDAARAWIRGLNIVGEVDVRRFASQVPQHEFGGEDEPTPAQALAKVLNMAEPDITAQGMKIATRTDEKGETLVGFVRVETDDGR